MIKFINFFGLVRGSFLVLCSFFILRVIELRTNNLNF